MKAARPFCITALVLALLGGSSGLAAQKEKVEEGRYALLRNGGLVAGSEHSWTWWRLPDGGFELEDHFQVDQKERGITGMMLAPGTPASPEFRKAVQERIWPSDVSAIFDAEHRLLSLTVSGVHTNGDPGVGLKCTANSSSIECAGTGAKAKLRVHERRGLFWWYSLPTLLRLWIAEPLAGSLGKRTQEVALLSFGTAAKEGIQVGMKFEPGAKISWGDKPALEATDLTISPVGPDTLVLGDRSFHAQKCRMEVAVAKGHALSLTTWTDAKGVILAVEDASRPSEVIGLVQYKRYADASPAAATPAEK